MVMREFVDRLEGDAYIAAQERAWIDIREWVEEDVVPLLATQTRLGGSVNGPGSSLDCTRDLIRDLPELLRRWDIHTMLDAPCGDWNWMQHVDLHGCGVIRYWGWDIDPEQIRRNRVAFSESRLFPHCIFSGENILTADFIPEVDVILCRDFLAHLPTEHISAVLDKFRGSGSRYLLASTYPGADNAFEYRPEDFAWLGYCERPYDLQERPFSLPQLDDIPEAPGPGGVISRPHELGLFQLNGSSL